MSYEEINEIRRSLKRTWKHFFRPFRGKLLPVQIRAIPSILDGNNVIIQSPTASGKTEAVIAPILERLLNSDFRSPAVLYICPTRALVYDLHERLVHQIQDLELQIAIRTGETRQFKPRNPQEILLTTPESLDSMLCRNKENLQTIEYIILDELHLLHGTYRGDQLRMDLIRLQQASNSKPQFAALSATFKNPGEIASQYFNPFKIIKVEGQRELDYGLVKIERLTETYTSLLSYFKKNGIKKILFFCNSRVGTEKIGQLLKSVSIWPSESIYVHHGSLGKYERLAAENALKKRRHAICVSTMTLEVGIDIGDIDMIVLVGPPPSVSSLLQRIGRGNRRENITRTIGLYTTEDDEKEFQNLFELAKKGELEQPDRGPCLSVAVQQILSVLYQNRHTGVIVEQLEEVLQCLPLEESLLKMLTDHLQEKEYIETHRRKFYPSVKTIDLGERGFIHSNIPGTAAYNVINETTGKSVGEIGTFDQINREFVLSGQRWRIVSIQGSKVKVAASTSTEGMPAYFTPAQMHGRYFGLLPPLLKRHCCEHILI